MLGLGFGIKNCFSFLMVCVWVEYCLWLSVKLQSRCHQEQEQVTHPYVDKEWKKLETIPAMVGFGRRQKQEGGYSASAKRQKGSPLSYTDGHMSPQKNAEQESKLQKYRGSVVLREDIVKDDSGAYVVFTEQGSSASQMTAAK